MMEQGQLEKVMGLIINAGNAKSDAMEAIQAAKKGDFSLAKEKLQAADQALLEAHHAQTELLTAEAQGEALELTLLVVHSQDHLMTSITFNDLAKEMVELYQRMAA
ncbi:PTS lactose/cellobiose transporter subunit IIA [Ligilactobacillus faecis]|uniref:PTS lactose/cellobiose transporter subunit IIA n=1 Tax=Ligilactobacillus faecis TaxID=762833 RepID=A0ABV4DR18_9LACO|nr:PTS lactose/cellobiose transporter subunit IIA [Ligilactobacillus faecis]WGN90289.1 PTS lactose/cellobiose transporter subunit IIA [Ligilactobacillus faecis]